MCILMCKPIKNKKGSSFLKPFINSSGRCRITFGDPFFFGPCPQLQSLRSILSLMAFSIFITYESLLSMF